MKFVTIAVGVCLSFVAGGQLLVAGSQKLRGFRAYSSSVGSPSLAAAIVAVDLVLGTWCLAARPYHSVLWWALAAFFATGAGYRAKVVLSPTRVSCACSPGAATDWPDVAANLIIAAAAIVVATTHVELPRTISLFSICVAAIFLFAVFASGQLRHRAPAGRLARRSRQTSVPRLFPIPAPIDVNDHKE